MSLGMVIFFRNRKGEACDTQLRKPIFTDVRLANLQCSYLKEDGWQNVIKLTVSSLAESVFFFFYFFTLSVGVVTIIP